MPVVEISSLSHPGVEIFCTLTEAQLRNRIEPDKGIFIVESPKVINISLVMPPTSLNVVAMCLSIRVAGNCLLH